MPLNDIEPFYTQWRAMIKEYNLKIAYLPPLKNPVLREAIKQVLGISDDLKLF